MGHLVAQAAVVPRNKASCVHRVQLRGGGEQPLALPGHVYQQLLPWPRGEQGAAGLAGSQGRNSFLACAVQR